MSGIFDWYWSMVDENLLRAMEEFNSRLRYPKAIETTAREAPKELTP